MVSQLTLLLCVSVFRRQQRWTSGSSSKMSVAAAAADTALFSWVGVIMYLPTEDPTERKEITDAFFDYRHACEDALWYVDPTLEPSLTRDRPVNPRHLSPNVPSVRLQARPTLLCCRGRLSGASMGRWSTGRRWRQCTTMGARPSCGSGWRRASQLRNSTQHAGRLTRRISSQTTSWTRCFRSECADESVSAQWCHSFCSH